MKETKDFALVTIAIMAILLVTSYSRRSRVCNFKEKEEKAS
jgi:hypothetical protein